MAEDLVVLLNLAVMAAFLVISGVMLSRYRELISSANASSRLAKDLWDALEARVKRQDERIVDLMARVELYAVQSSRQVLPETSKVMPQRVPESAPREPDIMMENLVEAAPGELPKASRPGVTGLSHTEIGVTLGKTELRVLKELVAGPRTSVEVNRLIGGSREHAARLMKNLYDSGLVVRDEQKKPYVYRMTNQGLEQVGKESNGK